MTADEVRKRLAAACIKARSQKAFAEKHGLSPAYISDVIKGRREPGPEICRALGIVREVTYRKLIEH